MKIYFSETTQGFYQDGFNSNIPEDAVTVSENKYSELYNKISNGFKVIVEDGVFSFVKQHDQQSEDFEVAERRWRDEQLNYADIELNKVQDSDPNSKGSVTEWRQYRKELRAWPDNKNFPNIDHRPTPPK
jgi:hypothetical protein